VCGAYTHAEAQACAVPDVFGSAQGQGAGRRGGVYGGGGTLDREGGGTGGGFDSHCLVPCRDVGEEGESGRGPDPSGERC
jgi:hypothetical protein